MYSTPDRIVRIIAVAALAFLWHPQSTAAAGSRDKDDCEKIKAEIRKVQEKMRRGYSAAQGVKLNAKLLELRERRLKACR